MSPAAAASAERFVHSPLVGLRIQTDRGMGTVTGPCVWSNPVGSYWAVELDSGETTARAFHVLAPLIPQRPMEVTRMPAATAEKPKRTRATKPATGEKPAPKKPAKKSKLAIAKEGDDAKLAKCLLANQTYSDSTWADRAKGETRRDKESRSAFIERVLLGKGGAA